EEEYAIPFGQAELAKVGSDMTLIGWGAQHHQNMEAARELEGRGISVEVLNMRTLNPLDIDSIVASISKTGRCLIAHEAPRTMGFGAEIAAAATEKCFLHLVAPIQRVCGLDTPYPNALEYAYLTDANKVKQAILELLEY